MNKLEREIWKPVERFPGYEISSYGRLKRCLRKSIDKNKRRSEIAEHILSPNGKANKYLKTVIRYQNVYIHRLVAEAFVPNPHNLPEVNHLDGNKQNNYFKNLEWCTEQYNLIHAINTGLRPIGERFPSAKLTDKQVEEIRRRVRNGESHDVLSKEFGVSRPYVSQIGSGKKRKKPTPRLRENNLYSEPMSASPCLNELVTSIKEGVIGGEGLTNPPNETK